MANLLKRMTWLLIGVFIVSCLLMITPVAAKSVSLTGIVTDSITGLPVSGATITVHGTGVTTNSVSSGSDGHYSLVFSVSSYIYAALCDIHKDGYVESNNNPIAFLGSSTSKDYKLAPVLRTLTGTVTDSITGQPVSNATISVHGYETTSNNTQSDSDGHYSVDFQTSGSLAVPFCDIHKDGYVENNNNLISLSGSVISKDYRLTPVLRTLTGTVTDSITGQPVSNATISVHGYETTSNNTLSDSDGYYSLDFQTSGSLAVPLCDIHKDGYVENNNNLISLSGSVISKDYRLTPVLRTLTGTVTDSITGQPVSNATISVHGYETTSNNTQSDSDGHYSVDFQTSGSLAVPLCDIHKDGYVENNNNLISLSGSVISKDYKLTPVLRTLTGTVTDSQSGQPVSNATISIHGYKTTSNNTSSDSDGHYSLDFQTSDSLAVPLCDIHKNGYVENNNNLISLSGSVISKDFQLTLTQTLNGTVVDRFTGLPVSNAKILINGNQVTSTGNGSFTLSNVTPTVVDINGNALNVLASNTYWSHSSLFSYSSAELQRGSKDLGTIELTPYLAGYVTNSANQPVSGAHITLTVHSLVVTSGSATSDNSGYYLSQLEIPDGLVLTNISSVNLTVMKDGYLPYSTELGASDFLNPSLHNITFTPIALNNCTPDHAETNNTSVSFTLTTSGIISPQEVRLVKAGQTNITAGSVAMTPDRNAITGTFNLRNAALGDWGIVVVNGDGAEVKWAGTFTILQQLVANFTANTTAGNRQLPVQFTDLSTGSPISWLWEFGDGNSSMEQSPVHIYTDAGNYTVNLTATNAGGSNTTAKTNYITVRAPVPPTTAPTTTAPTTAPATTVPTRIPTTIPTTIPVTPTPTATVPPLVANFSANVTAGQTPLAVQFTDATTGLVRQYFWQFGDGGASFDKNPVHTYSAAGKYTISLFVIDQNGWQVKTNEQYITVTAPGTPTVSPTVTTTVTATTPAPTTTTTITPIVTKTIPVTPTVAPLPIANFVVTYQSGAGSMGIQVTDASTNATVVKYDLGDGTTTAYKNFKYTYWQPGTYTVKLIATNDAGSSTKTVTVTVPAGSPTTTTVSPTVTVTTPAPTMTTVSPTTTMTTPVTPTVTSTFTPTPTPTIPNLPVANFTVTFPGGIGSMGIQITNTAVNATSVHYNLGDGATTAYPNFTYSYWQPGNYTINQTATNAAGSSNKTIMVTVPVGSIPTTIPPTIPTTTVSPTVTVTGSAFDGLHTIPGTLQAEDYDLGGEGVAYHDTTPGNEGGVYRHDDVDIEQLDTDGSPNVGWIRAGEWLGYTVNVSTAGTYTAGFRVASSHTGSSVQMYVDDGTTPVATVSVPNTGDWPVFQTVQVPVTLPAGTHRLKFSFPTDFVNINWISFA
ncbi:PKD domain-containing protein [Methanosphaerula palustris]|uniref:Carbohydrate binding family 6 n=1 Tax=Methanosphaerula palustris (strain ATCC BAA-1556 / DSM 19958 / E1-9c) TaxID=521011 RepID=B8GDL9_METPE|nr:PKD domain-containing protein [Methanosphaerula palustris]ACL17370.1 Carbohydrate binding family 6 [Methanosphaerula palustris E1-9c]